MAFFGTPFEQIAASGCVDDVIKAINDGENITKDDNAALRFASLSDQVEIMQILVDAGAVPDSRMLLAALKMGKKRSIRFLVQHGIPFNNAWLENFEIFDKISAETIALLINLGLPVLKTCHATLRTAAYGAMRRGDFKTFQFIGSLGIDINRIFKQSLLIAFVSRSRTGLSIKDLIYFADMGKASTGVSSEELDLAAKNWLTENSHYEDDCRSFSLFDDWLAGKFDLMTPAEMNKREHQYEIIERWVRSDDDD